MANETGCMTFSRKFNTRSLAAGLIAIAACCGITGAADPAPKPTLVSVTKIWDKAPHCAFTDLLRWKKQWLCCFREAQGHGGDNGIVRIITSTDGSKWTSLAVVRAINTC